MRHLDEEELLPESRVEICLQYCGDRDQMHPCIVSQTLPVPLTSGLRSIQRRSNVVLFGEMEADGSSLVNLILGLDREVFIRRLDPHLGR